MATMRGFPAFVSMSTVVTFNFNTGCAELKMC